MEFDLYIALAGFGVGILVGLTGMGGGALMTPLLILMGVRPVVAVGTDLLYGFVTKVFGAVQHYRQGNVNLDMVKRLAVGSLPGAAVGILFLAVLKGSTGDRVDEIVRHSLGFALILTAFLIFLGRRAPGFIRRRKDLLLSNSSLMVTGAAVGFLVTVTSVGSGTIIVALLLVSSSLTAREVVGTDIAHAVLLLGLAGMGHFSLGTVDLTLAGQILVGSIPGVLLGARLASRVPLRALRAILAGVLLVSGLKMAF
jgi:hypothetical protein